MLVDTSVWVNHFKRRNDALAGLLESEQVACHPFVIGELACGNLRDRAEILSLLSALPMLAKIDDDEMLDFIDRHHLMGRGLGLIDAHLLASCLLAEVDLWTADAKLAGAARTLGVDTGA